MTDNPYRPPETVANAESTSPAIRRDKLAWYAVLVVAAILEGGAAYRVFDGKPPGTIESYVFFAAPVVALLYSAYFALHYSGSLSVRKSAGQITGLLAAGLLIPAAGYVCFVTTCCCTNLIAGSVSIHGPPPVVWACAVGGVISATAMVFSCVLVAVVLRAIGRRIRKA